MPYFASLHEVTMAICETTAPSGTTAHHQVEAPAASSAAEARRSIAARSHRAPPPGPIGSFELGHLRPAEALGGSEQVDEPVSHEQPDQNPPQDVAHRPGSRD